MKTKILGMMAVALFSVPAFADTNIKCQSTKYTVTVDHLENKPAANYAINHVFNDQADVSLEDYYLSDRVLALSLNVDGVSKKFEVSATRTWGPKYTGEIMVDHTSQKVECTRDE